MKVLKRTCLLGVIAVVAPISCVLVAKSKIVTDKTAGLNGSFEITKSGLPVNWIFYTSKTVSSGDFDIVIDQNDFKDGKQSLKFVVRKCSDKGGRLSPGFSQEIDAVPGETYSISFWAKNSGCEFIARVGGVNAFHGDCRTMVKSRESIESWRQFSTKVMIPKEMKALRWELNILRQGTFWIDDLKIEKVTNQDIWR